MLTRAAVRAFSTEALKARIDVARKQFVVALKGDEAVISYDKQGKTITYSHTEVPEVFKGRGVGKILAKSALDYAKENKLDVVSQCEFLTHYYEKNKNSYSTIKFVAESSDN